LSRRRRRRSRVDNKMTLKLTVVNLSKLILQLKSTFSKRKFMQGRHFSAWNRLNAPGNPNYKEEEEKKKKEETASNF
jgi:hypothetical protein